MHAVEAAAAVLGYLAVRVVCAHRPVFHRNAVVCRVVVFIIVIVVVLQPARRRVAIVVAGGGRGHDAAVGHVGRRVSKGGGGQHVAAPGPRRVAHAHIAQPARRQLRVDCREGVAVAIVRRVVLGQPAVDALVRVARRVGGSNGGRVHAHGAPRVLLRNIEAAHAAPARHAVARRGKAVAVRAAVGVCAAAVGTDCGAGDDWAARVDVLGDLVAQVCGLAWRARVGDWNGLACVWSLGKEKKIFVCVCVCLSVCLSFSSLTTAGICG